MSIKDVREDEDFFFQEEKKEVIIESKGKKLTFYANAISYLEHQNILVGIARGKNDSAMLVAASITDEDGKKFTYDEALKLKKEIAQPFFDAAVEINSKGQSEKK